MFLKSREIVSSELRQRTIVSHYILVIFPQGVMNMEPITGLGEERHRHEGRMIPMRVSKFFDESPESDDTIGRYQCFVVSDIDFYLTCSIFRVGLFNRYADCG